MAPFVVDNEAKIDALLTLVTKRMRVEQAQLTFVDLEGVNLSRLRHDFHYAVADATQPSRSPTLSTSTSSRQRHSTSPRSTGPTLKWCWMESSNILTVFFDIRNDSDALHARSGVHVVGVHVACIIDLQVIHRLCYATRNPRGKNVNGLAKCIERDLTAPTSHAGRSPKLTGDVPLHPRSEGSMRSSLKDPWRTGDPQILSQEQGVMLHASTPRCVWRGAAGWCRRSSPGYCR
ncbi:hypothetical protein FOPE_10726 [Fonsecaea pedrosoi]|nr:hypothetical protein FOPE_10726 [Fonsecaea pedrosoi]